MSQWSTVRNRIAGKWQIPLFIISLVLLAGSILRIQPASTHIPFNDAIKQLDTLVSNGLYTRVVEIGDALLVKEGCTDTERAAVHLRLARALFSQAEGNRTFTADVTRQVIEHYGAAAADEHLFTAADFAHLGLVYERQRQFAEAVDHYNKAIEKGVDNRLDLRRRVLGLMRSRLDTPPHRFNELLDAFLADLRDERLDLTLWAIEQKLNILEELGRLEEASTLLARNRESFDASGLESRFSYLEALLMYKTGYYDQAETYLRTVRNGLSRSDETHAMTGWLLGRVVLRDGGPQRPLEALSFFSDVMSYHPGTPHAVASRIGTAEALAMLGRHEEAINAYKIALEEIEALDGQELVSRDVLRTSLSVAAEARRLDGQLRASLGYAQLVAALIDPDNVEQATVFLQQLGQAQLLLGEELQEQASKAQEASEPSADAVDKEARTLMAGAGETHLRLARINTLNERRSAEASWRAAELYAKAGERDGAAKLYRTFAAERPANPLVPRALLRIGQLREALGELPEAIEAYQECYRRFPRTLDGSRSLVPLAKCYLMSGPDSEDLARKTLGIVLDDPEVFTPQAPEFADALFLLGDVLNRRGSFERAITTLEEALERYPQDPRVQRARFWLADSYRRSGLALKLELTDAKFAGETEYVQAETSSRLTRARELYRQVINEYELRDPADLLRLDRLYLRHAYLYEADCLFETRQYRGAIKLYEEAAGIFKDTPSALAAFVQIINCHVFLGHPREARAALARAVILVDTLPQQAFDESVSPQVREDWKRYFVWLGESELF